MGADTGGRYRYTDASAELYGWFGIEGTTYQIGFDAGARLLGDTGGRTFLDFGCGTGRSARFLTEPGARHVYAVVEPDGVRPASSPYRTPTGPKVTTGTRSSRPG